jgi:hypothetical protein
MNDYNIGNRNDDIRRQQYISAISSTLSYLPSEITPIIVEGGGVRQTYLDNFTHADKKVNVVYTDNNVIYKADPITKGIVELLDIKHVIRTMNIKPNDMIIKLTGRYTVTSDTFFNTVIKKCDIYDVFIKYFNICTMQYDEYDCTLGCFAMRSDYLLLYQPRRISKDYSVEMAFAHYSKICGGNVFSIDNIGVSCITAENNTCIHI